MGQQTAEPILSRQDHQHAIHQEHQPQQQELRPALLPEDEQPQY